MAIHPTGTLAVATVPASRLLITAVNPVAVTDMAPVIQALLFPCHDVVTTGTEANGVGKVTAVDPPLVLFAATVTVPAWVVETSAFCGTWTHMNMSSKRVWALAGLFWAAMLRTANAAVGAVIVCRTEANW